MTMTVQEAQSKLPELIARAQAGEEILLTSDDPETVVSLEVRKAPVLPTSPRLGYLAHLGLTIPDSFFDPLPEDELRLWYGEEE